MLYNKKWDIQLKSTPAMKKCHKEMLYNERWEIAPKPTPTLKSFKNWVSKQDRNKRYVFSDSGKCAVAQFMDSIGYNHYNLNLHKKDITYLFGTDAADAIAHSRTFGQLKDKLNS